MLKKIAIGTGILVLVLIAGVLVFARMVGAWNVIFPSHHHESVPPDIPENLATPTLLVFSKTNGFRHVDGIAGGIAFFDKLAEDRGFGIFHTENSAVFNAKDLSRFSAVIFNNATGDVLSADQEHAFQQWLEAGGGWLGIHGAGDDSHTGWAWYLDHLIGAEFIGHTMGPQFQPATLHVDDTSHVATQALPLSWEHTEEWYSWDENIRDKGFNVLVTVDESTYTPRLDFLHMDHDLRMGDHPIVWNRCIGSGRSLYSALGHQGEAFESAEYQALLAGAIDWILDEAACTRD